MKNIQGKKIAVIGGGPGGLTLARLLQINGAEVKVYERDLNKEVRVQGATLDLHQESGLKALREAGLIDSFKNYYRPGADRTRIMNKDTHIMLDQHAEDIPDDFEDERFRPEIDRGPLRKLLLESLLPGTVIWDHHFQSMQKIGNVWEIRFKNGNTALADIVIAADGANSRIRPLITSIPPFYSGVTMIEGSVYDAEKRVPHMHQLLNGGKIFAMEDEKMIILSSKGDGSLVFYLSWKTDEEWSKKHGIDFNDKAAVIHWFQRTFRGWSDTWLELLENVSSSLIIRPMYCMPVDQTWEALPDLTMLGDAAHLMPPFAGEGVNMAMLDALELSQCLLDPSFPDLQAAIAWYEQQMRARASETATITLEQTASLHSENAVKNMIEMFQ